MKILDATASVRGMWFQKENPYTIFLDKRNETVRMKNGIGKGYRNLKINPDIQAAWQTLPFQSGCFDMVIFDPPHIIRNENIKQGSITLKYGVLYIRSWREELRLAFVELFRVLKHEGILILKWAETDMNKDEIVTLSGKKPLFGTTTGNKNNTYWLLFINS